jgi:DNA polymerase-4
LADLLKDTEAGTKKVRLLGVALSSLHTSALLNYQQLDLFNIQFNKRGSLKAI